MRKRCISFATVLVCLALSHDPVRAATASCPLGSAAYPFSESSLPRYDVSIPDGGPGDLDGAVDGACTIAWSACLGAPACTPTPLEELRASVRGRPLGTTPRALGRSLIEAFGRAPGAEPGARSVRFDEEPAPEACGHIRFRMNASKRSDRAVTIRVSTHARRARSATRGRIRCLPADASPGDATCTASDGSACPRQPDAPLPPPPLPPLPPQEPSAPAVTTTTTVVVPPVPTTTTTPPVPSARRLYISPKGDDGAVGTIRTRPLRSFERALRRLEPGDTLVLLDGTYTRETTGLPRIDCGAGGNARSGTAERPITIRAEHERRAFLSSDGQAAGLEMTNCAWWRIEGLRAASTDDPTGDQGGGFPFRVNHVTNVVLRRLLASHNNRAHNTHLYGIENSHNVLVEECEGYFFHRHAFSVWRSSNVTLRRCYANSMQSSPQGCCSEIDNRHFGDEAFSLYGTSYSTVENSISENQANGFQIHGIANPDDPSGSGGRHNQVLGCVSLNDAVSVLVSSRQVGGTYHNALGNYIRDLVVVGNTGNALFLRGASNTVVENVTLFGSPDGSGFVADAGDSALGGTCEGKNEDGCGFVARNVLSLGHDDGYGFIAVDQSDWRIEHSNASGSSRNWVVGEPIHDTAGHVQRSRTAPAGPIGLGANQCVMWIPEGSPMKRAGKDGRDIGANIVYRYENGALTRTPLWHPVSGAFPCGAVVRGINDGPRACINVHTRLNVNRNGCALPVL